MRILLLSHYYEPESGAPQQRWSALVRRFVAAGHEVAVIAPSPHYPTGHPLPGTEHMAPGSVHAGQHGETVHRVAFRPYSGELGSRAVDQLVAAVNAARVAALRFRSRRPDVVVSTVPSLAMLGAGAGTSRLLGTPLVTEMRDAWPDLLDVAGEWDDPHSGGYDPAEVRGRGRVGLRRLSVGGVHRVTTRLQRSSAAVVTTTDSFAEVLRGRGVRGVHVIRNGAHALPGYLRHSPRRPDGRLRVLYPGTVGRAQGLSTAIRAAAVAAADGLPVTLRIVGDGAERSRLAELAERVGAPVEMCAPVGRAELAGHYAWADSLLVSLRPWPGLALTVPSKLYEAMALGIHVSGSVTGEAAGIIDTQRAGHTSPPGDAEALAAVWRELVREPAALDVPPTGAEWVAEHAGHDRLAEDYLALLSDVAGRA